MGAGEAVGGIGGAFGAGPREAAGGIRGAFSAVSGEDQHMSAKGVGDLGRSGEAKKVLVVVAGETERGSDARVGEVSKFSGAAVGEVEQDSDASVQDARMFSGAAVGEMERDCDADDLIGEVMNPSMPEGASVHALYDEEAHESGVAHLAIFGEDRTSCGNSNWRSSPVCTGLEKDAVSAYPEGWGSSGSTRLNIATGRICGCSCSDILWIRYRFQS